MNMIIGTKEKIDKITQILFDGILKAENYEDRAIAVRTFCDFTSAELVYYYNSLNGLDSQDEENEKESL